MDRLYLGRIVDVVKLKSDITEVKILDNTSDTLMLGQNISARRTLSKNDVNKNIRLGEFVMFSDSKEYLIEQMREYVSDEVDRMNKRISDLQSSFERVLNEN